MTNTAPSAAVATQQMGTTIYDDHFMSHVLRYEMCPEMVTSSVRCELNILELIKEDLYVGRYIALDATVFASLLDNLRKIDIYVLFKNKEVGRDIAFAPLRKRMFAYFYKESQRCEYSKHMRYMKSREIAYFLIRLCIIYHAFNDVIKFKNAMAVTPDYCVEQVTLYFHKQMQTYETKSCTGEKPNRKIRKRATLAGKADEGSTEHIVLLQELRRKDNERQKRRRDKLKSTSQTFVLYSLLMI